MTCPACDGHSSSILRAYREGAECPNCGFPAEATHNLLFARGRGANQTLQEAYVRAAAAAASALQRENDLLRAKVAAFERVAERPLADFGSPW